MKKKTSSSAFLLLHDIRSTHNVGSIFRTADAAGVSKIFLTGYTPRPVDRFGRKVAAISKTALGAEDSIVWEYHSDPLVLIQELKKSRTQIIGIEQAKNSINYKKVKIKKPVLLIVGNEVEGISKEILDECDVIAEIPMRGEKESLNVAVACGVALYGMLDR